MGNTLYEQFHNNVKGVGPLNNTTDSIDKLQTTYEQIRDNLTQALSGIKATYTGNAADAMSDAFTPLADSFNDGANFAGSAALSTTLQAESFATAQAKITNQVPVPAAPWYEPVDPFSTDHDDAVNQNSQIDSANEAAYNAYGSDTTGNLGYVQPAPTATSGFGRSRRLSRATGPPSAHRLVPPVHPVPHQVATVPLDLRIPDTRPAGRAVTSRRRRGRHPRPHRRVLAVAAARLRRAKPPRPGTRRRP